MVTDSGDLVVLAVQRKGEDRGRRETTLAVGDTLLLQGTWTALDEQPRPTPTCSSSTRRTWSGARSCRSGHGAGEAIVVLVGMVVLLATGLVPPAIAGLLAAGAMVLLARRHASTRPTARSRGRRSCSSPGMIPLSTAMTQTGAADLVADALVGVVGDAGPYALLAGLFLHHRGPRPAHQQHGDGAHRDPDRGRGRGRARRLAAAGPDVASTVAAAASFLTPVATPVNMMVMGPGGYRFGDYWKLGLPLLPLFFAVAVFLVPVFWPF